MMPLMPAAEAPAMWSLEISTFRGWTPGAQHYYAKVEGPDRTVHVMYEIAEQDLVHLDPQNGDRIGMHTERFATVDDATAAGIVAFGAVADADDILVPGGPVDEEWPLVAPEAVLHEAKALQERGLLTTWLQVLSRYRQWRPGVQRGGQHLVVRHADGSRWAVAEKGEVYR